MDGSGGNFQIDTFEDLLVLFFQRNTQVADFQHDQFLLDIILLGCFGTLGGLFSRQGI